MSINIYYVFYVNRDFVTKMIVDIHLLKININCIIVPIWEIRVINTQYVDLNCLITNINPSTML